MPKRGHHGHALAHRGPDAEGLVGRGTRRAGSPPLEHPRHGREPAVPVGDDALVFNGEVYNYLELRRELEAQGAHRFVTSGDTEVVLAAFVTGALKVRCGASTACSPWRGGPAQRGGWCSRTASASSRCIGTRPSAERCFSLQKSGLARHGVGASNLEQSAISDQWMYGTVHAPATIVQNVNALEPGSLLVVRDDEPTPPRGGTLRTKRLASPASTSTRVASAFARRLGTRWRCACVPTWRTGRFCLEASTPALLWG